MHKQKITDELITEAIVKTSRDRYGQTIMVNLQVDPGLD